MRDEPIVTGDAPSTEDGPRTMKIIWVKPTIKLHVTWLSRGFHGQLVHWCPLTVPCEKHAGCPYCRRDKPRQMSGYAHVLNRGDNRQYVLQFPDTIAGQLLKQIATKGALRGRAFELVRGSSKPNDPVFIRDAGAADVSAFPEVDVMPSLLKIWGINRARVLNKEAPMDYEAEAERTFAKQRAAATRLDNRDRRNRA